MTRASKRDYQQSEAKCSSCRKCRSTRRSAYFGQPQIRVFDFVQRRPDGTEFTRLIRRRTKCTDCNQFRFDLSYEFVPDDIPSPAATPKKKSPAARKKKPAPAVAITPPDTLPTFLGAASINTEG
jgi:hypothetical protein